MVPETRGGPVRLPPHSAGMCIGLFGGSFNPAHDGHRRASLIALSRLRLDRIWWLVTPGNPLKDNESLPSAPVRMEAARRVANHPRIIISDLEAQIGTRYTFQTVRYLVERCPGVRFVWIMGADNLANFHRWQHWRDIARSVAIAVIDRPGSTLRAMQGQGGQTLLRHRVREGDAAMIARKVSPAFVFLHGPRSNLSSTDLRKRRAANGPAIEQLNSA